MEKWAWHPEGAWQIQTSHCFKRVVSQACWALIRKSGRGTERGRGSSRHLIASRRWRRSQRRFEPLILTSDTPMLSCTTWNQHIPIKVQFLKESIKHIQMLHATAQCVLVNILSYHTVTHNIHAHSEAVLWVVSKWVDIMVKCMFKLAHSKQWPKG